MDDSSKYTKMCEKSWDIQKQRAIDCAFNSSLNLEPSQLMKFGKSGDCFYHHYFNEIQYKDRDDFHIQAIGGRITWLPHQGQLQDMIGETTKYRLLYRFDNFYHNLYNGFRCTDDCFSTVHQLWLAFVMKECFSKIWDEEKWIAL